MVSAVRSRRGASYRLLELVSTRRLVPLATTALFLEYEDVLKRPAQRKVSGLTVGQADRMIGSLAANVEPVDVRFTWRPQLGDPGDELVLEAAVNGHADALITFKVADFIQAAPRFGLTVLRPQAVLERVNA